jgi:Ni/Co efflux regulator RcnB
VRLEQRGECRRRFHLKRTLFWIVALSLALSTGAMAKDHDEHGKGKGHEHKAAHHDRDDDRWESRDGWEYHRFEGDHRPPGWSQGKKVGWKDCGLPPGQAKKYGCYKYRYHDRDYYWYRNDVGHIVIRRPIISVRAGVDIH